MKIKNVLLGLILLAGFDAFAQSDDRVRDELITTTDRACGIHYLTHGNTVGWYLTEVTGACPNGLLDGMAQVTLRNAFGKVVQQISGFFAQGFPTQSDYGHINLKTLWLSDTADQSLMFDLGKEERLNIRYFGKMTAARKPDGTYSAFNACAPAIVLAVTPDLSLFEDDAVQQELINSVLNRLAPVCPETHRVYFYGSAKENPENQDIAFFADIDLETGHIKIRRLPASPRFRDILTNPQEAAEIPIPKEIRRETGLPVVQITPVMPESKSVFVPAEEPMPPQRQIPVPAVQPNPLVSGQTQKPVVQARPLPVVQALPQPVATINPPLPPDTDTPTEPAPAETIKDLAPAWDDVPALLTASRLLKQPVEGKALVHIARFDAMGIALTDNPVALRIKGEKLPLGWVAVQGTFSYTPSPKSTDPIGFVQVQSVTPIKEK